MSAFVVQRAVGLAQQGKALFLGSFAESVNVAGYVHQLGCGQALQVFEDRFDHAHVTSI